MNSKPKRRTRNDPRKEATRTAIIEAAESLFAEFGIDGVSLRQIGTASGSSNTGVVAYHFGDKATLVEAIFHYRLPGIEARRGELLAEVQQAGGESDLLALLKALWQPLFEQRNEQGQHSYAGFLAALMRSNWGPSRVAVSEHYAISTQLGELMEAALPRALRPLFLDRLNSTTLMVTGVLQLIDQSDLIENKHREQADVAQTRFKDTLHMVCAALLATTGK